MGCDRDRGRLARRERGPVRDPGQRADGGDRRGANCWAASARTGRACRARRCCVRWRCSTSAGHCPGAHSVGDRTRLRRRPRTSRLVHPRPRRQRPGEVGERRRDRRRSAGTGRLTGEKTRRGHRPRTAASAPSHARHAVVLATGTTATVPPIAGLREALPWTSRDVTNLHEVPRRVAVIGGGVVACESATWLARSRRRELTLIERGCPRCWPQRAVRRRAGRRAVRGQRGVEVLLSTEVDAVRRAAAPEPTGEGGSTAARRRSPPADRRSSVDELVVAAGRTPATRRHRAGARSGSTSAARTATSTPTTSWRCSAAPATGCTRSATSPAGPCSPTWASTRAGSPAP